MMNIESLKRDEDALIDLFNGHTNVVIEYLFILVTNCICFIYHLILAVLLWQ